MRAGIQFCAIGLGLALLGCAPALTPEGARVRPVSEEFAVGCERLGRVEGVGPWAAVHSEPDGPTSINRARNEVARLGGDAMIVQVRDRAVDVGFGKQWITRAMALKCGL